MTTTLLARSVNLPNISCSALPASTGRPRGDWAEQPSRRRKPADNGYTISASEGQVNPSRGLGRDTDRPGSQPGCAARDWTGVSSPQREESVEDCAVRERVRVLAGLAEEIRARPCARAVRLVAVDGRGGAGKSTLARALAAACGGAPVVRVDDFLYWRDIEGWWPRLEREALRPLLSGSPARFRVRDWANDPLGQGLGRWAEVPPADVVIVEGVTSSRQAISADLTMALWVQAPRGGAAAPRDRPRWPSSAGLCGSSG